MTTRREVIALYGVGVSVGAGAWPSKRGRSASMHAHDGALLAQIVADGRAISRSSRVPARTKIRCGRASASLNRWVPQDGQKRARALMRSPQLGQKMVSGIGSPVASVEANGYHLRPMEPPARP